MRKLTKPTNFNSNKLENGAIPYLQNKYKKQSQPLYIAKSSFI